MTEQKKNQIVIDATNAVLGRLCSYVTKQAFLGKNIVLVNCSKAVVSGIRSNIVAEYNVARRRGGSSLNGPHFPKDPSRLVRRTLRGMLRYKKARGLDAFNRIVCYNDVPKEFQGVSKILAGRPVNTTYITLEELEKVI